MPALSVLAPAPRVRLLPCAFVMLAVIPAIFLVACNRNGDVGRQTSVTAMTESMASAKSASESDMVERKSTSAREFAKPVGTPALADIDQQAPKITVMSWNLEWFYDDADGDNYSKLAKEMTAPSREQWDWRRDQIAGSIHQAQPAVLAMQEIENKRVLWYLTRALIRNHQSPYRELFQEGDDVFTEQDVGFLYRDRIAEKAKPNEWSILPIEVGTFGRNHQMRADESLAEVSKQLWTRFEVKLGNEVETVTVLTLHLRAKEEAVAIRTKQARTIHRWLADRIKTGENVIVLGDLNTEINEVPAPTGSDMAAVCGLENDDPNDDLIDLHQFLPQDRKGTHLLPGKAFDRILVSRSLLQDDPDRIDLSVVKMESLKELSVRGNVDTPEEHWEQYWQQEEATRDLSDHWPIMATFQLR